MVCGIRTGHSSNIGVVCAIDLETNVVLDCHLLSKYCQKCTSTGEKVKRVYGDATYQVWYQRHAAKCEKNFDDTSGMMEVR